METDCVICGIGFAFVSLPKIKEYEEEKFLEARNFSPLPGVYVFRLWRWRKESSVGAV